MLELRVVETLGRDSPPFLLTLVIFYLFHAC
jgi:hypothetical protein